MTIGRRPKSIRPVRKEVSLPEDIVEAVDAILFAPDSSYNKLGAWSEYVTELINADLKKRANHEHPTSTR